MPIVENLGRADPRPPEPDGTPDLARFAKAARRRWKLIVLVTALVVGGALAYSLTSEEEYTATAKLVFGRGEPANALVTPVPSGGAVDIERDLNTNAQLITEANVAARVRRTLGLPLSISELQAKVETEIEENSDIVSIEAKDRDPERAAEIANGFATEFVEFRRDAARENIEEAADLARARLDSLSAQDRQSDEGRQLEARLRELEIAAALQTAGVELVREARPPASPTSPRPVFTGILAGALGLILGIVLAAALELTDRRLKNEDELEELFGLPVLAAVPRRAESRPAVRGAEDRGQQEGYATLATNLRFFKLGRDVTSLMVTSPDPAEGKTSVTLGLARSLAALGLRVVAIEADLRHPAFSMHAGLPRPSGLTSILAEVSSFADELVELDLATMKPVDPAYSNSGSSLWVLPAGPPPPNPQALLSSAAMRRVVADASSFAEVVIVDTAPVATVNDPVALVGSVDATVLVIRLNRTTKDQTRRAIRALGNVGAPVLGIVVTDVAVRSGPYYGPPRAYEPWQAPESATRA
jgi:receptor protein-tyrosine kinase